ncbi:GNAT family N-acetyltransferase [Clostridium bowmanii]|uniref:GNAT family N-acetyltransferase n=1 Tax=Clostridium bowmanii TaxID=132925 RepID=UPI001C0C1DB3|nr:GNAT family N-acetyltransferase [Clostridium bowmanii]MBU3190763.1 GNAT family N-acetyltransferase [Clostridium bowmanii]MCA1074991.1 GNAT family N-acetyltransferase [Clostridium bowmanii]
MYNNIRIETEQLIIRNFMNDDLQDLYNIVNAEEIMEYVPFTKSRKIVECENLLHNIMMKRYKESTPENFVGFILLVTCKETNKVVGFVGLCPLTYDKTENELFYGLFKEYWGKGYGTEIAKSMVKYGMEYMKLSKMVATVNEGNDISIKILIKAGMNYEKIIDDEDTKDSSYEGELFYSISLNEYLGINSIA